MKYSPQFKLECVKKYKKRGKGFPSGGKGTKRELHEASQPRGESSPFRLKTTKMKIIKTP